MDKLLNAVKDFSTIKKYLEAINQTTDDYLFMYDIPNNKIQLFGTIDEFFEISSFNDLSGKFEDILPIVHPADRSMLCADVEKIRLGTKESLDIDFRMFNRRGETVWVNSRGKVLHDENGAPHAMIGRISEEALRHLFNPITGLWNKTKLREDLKVKLHAGKGCLMMLGIPALADINLSHGREFGNKLLCEIADVLEEIECIEESYHVDNNNFAIIIHGCNSGKIEEIYDKICFKMQEKCTVFAGVVPIDNSIFIDVSQIIDSATITLQEATQHSNGRINFFSADEIQKRISELTLLEELKESVQNDFEGFEVHYQPQIKSGSYELYGVEALLRFNSSKIGRVFPDQFIPILEHSGLIQQVGMWVLEQALNKCKQWRAYIPDLLVAVNFSSVQFDDHSLGEKIVDALKAAQLPGEALTVELTESVPLNDNNHYYNLIKYIKSYGVRFSIDDFGTGYSNLKYLKHYDVNEIKIDRSFISKIDRNTYNYRLISNVIEFAKTNSIHACCEGVETARELSILESLQPDFFQGYLFDKPCTAEEIELKYIHDSSDEYKARISSLEDIYKYNEEYGGIHFDHKNILRENNMGLWIVRLDEKKNRFEMHVDEVMEHLLGLEDKLSPKDCYDFWRSRIYPEDIDYVRTEIKEMINSKKNVRLKYRWNHPKLGEVTVRCSGICTQHDNNLVVLEGYHRLLSGS